MLLVRFARPIEVVNMKIKTAHDGYKLLEDFDTSTNNLRTYAVAWDRGDLIVSVWRHCDMRSPKR